MNKAEYWIETLQLKPHPEGGFYKEMYRTDEKVAIENLPDRYVGERNFATSIYFLLPSEDISAFHRIASDELWFFHAGSQVEIYVLDKNGLQTIKLGISNENGSQLQAVIPRQTWFAAKVVEPDSYCLVSCVVSPGFDFADFELAQRGVLLNEYREFDDIIIQFTRV